MMSTRIVLLAASLVAVYAAPAEAYVRTMTKTGQPMHWDHSCIAIEMGAGDLPPLLDLPTAVQAAQAAVGAWSQPALACSALNLSLTATLDTEDTPDASTSPIPNRIIFRRSQWCSQQLTTGKTVCYDPSALAITSVIAQLSDGHITSAQIEVNAVQGGFVWGDATASTTPASIQDLQDVLTHEMGHLVGLDHNCYQPSTDADGNPIPPAVDNLGNTVPDCRTTTDPAIRAATMFASASPGDTQKRTLEQDDIDGVCSIYPANVPLECEAPARSNGGCSFGGGRPGFFWALGLAAVGLVAVRLPRRRPSSPNLPWPTKRGHRQVCRPG